MDSANVKTINFNPANRIGNMVCIKFEDFDHYPLTGDEYILQDYDATMTLPGKVQMVNWTKKLVYILVDWPST